MINFEYFVNKTLEKFPFIPSLENITMDEIASYVYTYVYDLEQRENQLKELENFNG